MPLVGTSKSKVAVYDTEIKAKLKAGQNARSIYQDLYVEESYRGSYDSVKRYVRAQVGGTHILTSKSNFNYLT